MNNTRHADVYMKTDHSPCAHDAYYVVECWEFGKCLAIIPCGEHSRHWADSIADNWFTGVLTLDKIDKEHYTQYARYVV